MRRNQLWSWQAGYLLLRMGFEWGEGESCRPWYPPLLLDQEAHCDLPRAVGWCATLHWTDSELPCPSLFLLFAHSAIIHFFLHLKNVVLVALSHFWNKSIGRKEMKERRGERERKSTTLAEWYVACTGLLCPVSQDARCVSQVLPVR